MISPEIRWFTGNYLGVEQEAKQKSFLSEFLVCDKWLDRLNSKECFQIFPCSNYMKLLNFRCLQLTNTVDLKKCRKTICAPAETFPGPSVTGWKHAEEVSPDKTLPVKHWKIYIVCYWKTVYFVWINHSLRRHSSNA